MRLRWAVRRCAGRKMRVRTEERRAFRSGVVELSVKVGMSPERALDSREIE